MVSASNLLTLLIKNQISPAYQWKLDDNAVNTAVIGTIAGTLTGGNTSDVHATINGHSAFHLDGSTQYATIPLVDLVTDDEIAHLWTKQENGILSDRPITELCKNPSGGWYMFGVKNNNGVRWSTADLITFTDETIVLPPGGAGTWDANLDGVMPFQKPNGDWMMLYRGNDGTNLRIGLATSSDGTTWTRKDNGGVNDGLFEQFGTNYDPFAVLLVGTTYYVYVNGYPDHGHLGVYYSTDDFNTFTGHNSGEPVFNDGFCPYVWKYQGFYYIVISRDLNNYGSAVGDHGLALYRSPDPFFDYGNREFLGYAVINDQTYDDRYLDTPTMPFTDIYRDTYAPEFGNVLNMIYTGDLDGKYARATSTLAAVAALPVLTESYQERYCRTERTYSLWVQFDSLTAGDVVFSIGATLTDGAPPHYLSIQGSTPKYISLFFYDRGDYQYANVLPVIDTPYHIVIVDALAYTKCYINGVLALTWSTKAYTTDGNFLYIGNGSNGTKPLDGYIWDFKIYNMALTERQVVNLYLRGTP